MYERLRERVDDDMQKNADHLKRKYLIVYPFSQRTIKLLLLGLFILILSTVVIGVGNYLAPPE